MTYAVASIVSAGPSCSNCNETIESQAKFCGSCGFIVAPDSFSILQYQQLQSRQEQAGNTQARQVPPSIQKLPSFALPSSSMSSARSQELHNEIDKITMALARERLFLCLQMICFLAVNLFGFWVAWKCYFGFIGDEMSRAMMASTPFLFINSIALVILAPIKGTRAEIARLKEHLSYVRFNLEFGHLK